MIETVSIEELKKQQDAHIESMKDIFRKYKGQFSPAAILYTVKELLPKNDPNLKIVQEGFDLGTFDGVVGVFVPLLPHPKEFYDLLIDNAPNETFTKKAKSVLEEVKKLNPSMPEDEIYGVTSEALLEMIGGNLGEVAHTILVDTVQKLNAFAFVKMDAVQFMEGTGDVETIKNTAKRQEGLCATLETAGYRRSVIIPFKEVHSDDGAISIEYGDNMELVDDGDPANWSMRGDNVFDAQRKANGGFLN